ncbi:DUF2304 domain-containing protein [Shewanella halifaxensis]|uniref:DUF2304 domain-containing protein n=1 Tax=Shewanella halifaxensis TaxID=271098 RepID=UPI001F18EDB4|nr:DUF2304 domain-containing protein [Shewanella halifaxensis]
MQHYQIFSSIIAVMFFVVAFVLVRKDNIHPSSAIRWTLLSLLILVAGLFPNIFDVLAKMLGVSYAPIIPVILACIILLIKALLNDIERTKDRVKLERLIQRVAILESQLKQSNSETK